METLVEKEVTDVLRELLAEREVLIDVEFFMRLCELFSVLVSNTPVNLKWKL